MFSFKRHVSCVPLLSFAGRCNLEGLSITNDDIVQVYGKVTCAKCEFTAVTPSAFEKHVNEVHNNVYPYVCCDKAFSSRSAFKGHVDRMHEGIFPLSSVQKSAETTGTFVGSKLSKNLCP
jgi:hypothetical protein